MKVYRDSKGRFTSKPSRTRKGIVEDAVPICRDERGRFAKKGSNLPKRDSKGRFIAAVVVREAAPKNDGDMYAIRKRAEKLCKEVERFIKPAFTTRVVKCSCKKCKTFRLLK